MPRDSSKELSTVIAEAAQRKAEAARARSDGRVTGVEDSRDVYLAACSSISQVLVAHGFRYAKSGPHASSTRGMFAYKVSFQSSHNNIAGRHVRLWMHATVRSKELKAWRGAQSTSTSASDFVAGGMAHLLKNEHAMVEWELADPTTRATEIADAVAFIQSDVLPYFAQFDTPEHVITTLRQRAIPAFGLQASVEFALCFGEREHASAILDRFVRERSDLAPEISEAEQAGLRNPKSGPGNYAEQVVFLRRTYQL